jgi:hypothetical protein
MDHLLFCINHPQKIAKRHCNKCEQNLCNECIFESHIEHYEEITKIEYTIDTKHEHYSQFILKEIESIIEKSIKELKPQLQKIVLDKTEQYIKEHKNLQLKLSNPPEKKPLNHPEKKPLNHPEKKPVNAYHPPKQPKKKENLKNQIITKTGSFNINERAKMFSGQNSKEIKIKVDENNPFNKGKKGNVKAMASIFEQK